MSSDNQNIIINELLTYINHYLNNSAISNIIKIANSFYSNEEVLEAKKILWNEYSSELGSLKGRRDTDKRSCSEANLNDIIDALLKLDSEQKMPKILAKNIERIPDRQTEELNMLFVLERLTKLEKTFKTHENLLSQVSIDIVKINDTIDNPKVRDIKDEKESELDLQRIKKLITDEVSKVKNQCYYNNKLNNESHNDELNICSSDLDGQIANTRISLSSDAIEDISDSDMIKRFNALKSCTNDQVPEKNNNWLDMSFEDFLDNYEDYSASISEFEGKRNSILNDTILILPPSQFKDSYSNKLRSTDVGKVNQKMTHRPTKAMKVVVKDNTSKIINRLYDDEGYEKIESKSAAKRRINRLEGAPSSLVNVWVYKVSKGNVNEIKNHLLDKNIRVCDVTKISKEGSKYRSFKISLPKFYVRDVLSREFWPVGIGCRIWRDYKKDTRSRSFVSSKFQPLR